MTRFALLLSAFGLLGACAAPVNDAPDRGRHPNISPTNYEPGLHVSGQVDIGVVSSF